MQSFIDYVAWVAIGLIIVALPFALGAAYIFLDEAVRRLTRSVRKPRRSAISRLGSQTAQSDPERLRATERLSQTLQGPHPALAKPRRTASPTIWRTAQGKFREAKSQRCLRLHIGHHKPANAKP